MSILLPFRRSKTVLPHVAALTDIPELVLGQMLARGETLHRPGGMYTVCGLASWPMWVFDAEKYQRLEPVWCVRCWPGFRCAVCQRPSGANDECPTCLATGIDAGKAFERSTA